MRQLFLLVLFGITLFSCQQVDKSTKKEKDKTKINDTFQIDPYLTKSNKDSLFIDEDYRNPKPCAKYYFRDKHYLCKLKNDTISIENGMQGYYEGYSFKLIISKDEYSIELFHFCDYDNGVFKSTVIKQTLTLNKKVYKTDDTLIGSIYILDSVSHNDKHNGKDTVYTFEVEIKGKFKVRIHDSLFNWKSLSEENNFTRFLKLSQNNPDTITKVDLYECGLHEIPKELFLFKNVEYLDLSDNDLSNVDLSSLCQLTKLKSISFQGCNLSSFPSCILCFKDLQQLNIHGNEVKKLPEELYRLNKIKELTISGNKLTSISPSISNLTRLEMLGFGGNKILELPESILKLKNLKTIYPPDSMTYFPKQLRHCLPENVFYNPEKLHIK